MITFETVVWFAGVDERYFQYWPIRFFWPALSTLAFYAYRRRPRSIRAAIVSLAGAIGSIWNADTGLMIEVAFAAFLVGKWVLLAVRHREQSGDERRHLLATLVMQILIFATSAGCMAAYLTVKSGHAPHWQWLSEYQHVFYKVGFMMLPLHMRPNPWMPVLAVYLAGLLAAVSSWIRSPGSRTADLIFFLSFLGLGLFVYYEGRSHVLNLFSVAWPALSLSVILADRIMRSVRARLLPRVYLCLPAVTLALTLFCCFPFVKHTGELWRETVSGYKTRGTPVDPLVAGELKFIRAHSTPGETCLILSKRQGLYYTATGLVSPLSGPGYEELILQRDQDALLIQLSNLKTEGVFEGAGINSKIDLDFDPQEVLQQYSVTAKNPEGSMLYLQLRK